MDGADVERLLEKHPALGCPTSVDPEEWLRDVCSALPGVESVTTYSFGETARGGLELTDLAVTGSSRHVSAAAVVAREAERFGHVRNFTFPAAEDLRFSSNRTMLARRGRAGDVGRLWNPFFRSRGIGDAARIMIYDGEEFAGLFVLAFPVEEVECLGRRALAAVNKLRPLVGSALRLAHRSRVGLGPGEAVFTASGKLEFASEAAQLWLATADTTARLAEAVRMADAGLRPQHAAVTTPEGETIVRLEGSGQAVRYLVSFERLFPLARCALSVLTPRQRAVARMVADGATSAEVAVALGITVNTVRQHRKDIFLRLEISTVQGLSRKVLEGQGARHLRVLSE